MDAGVFSRFVVVKPPNGTRTVTGAAAPSGGQATAGHERVSSAHPAHIPLLCSKQSHSGTSEARMSVIPSIMIILEAVYTFRLPLQQ